MVKIIDLVLVLVQIHCLIQNGFGRSTIILVKVGKLIYSTNLKEH
jgi:hypothetical protein